MKNRKNGSVAGGIEELVDVPGCGERPGFRFAIANNGRNDQFWIVKRRTAGMRENVPEFSAFMNRSGRFWSAVTPDSSGKRELMEELPQAIGVETLLGINF